MVAGGEGAYQKKKNDWEFQSYKGTNIDYDVLCETVNSDQEEKMADILNGNHIITLINLVINVDKCLVCRECAQ